MFISNGVFDQICIPSEHKLAKIPTAKKLSPNCCECINFLKKDQSKKQITVNLLVIISMNVILN
jgi:hypothetical protein